MWIVTAKMIFSLYPEDTVEQKGKQIMIYRNGSPETFILTFNELEKAQAGWKKLQDAIKKNFQNVSIYDCETDKREPASKKGRLF